MTTGVKTSEFYLSLIAIVIGAVTSSGLIGSDSVVMKVAGLVVSILAALGYTASRTALKVADAKAPPSAAP